MGSPGIRRTIILRDFQIDLKPMLTFEEIAKILDKDMPVIYKELTTTTIATALKGAPPEVVNKFFGNMSLPYSTMIRDEMGKLGEVPSEDIEDQRTKVIKTIGDLRSRGKIG